MTVRELIERLQAGYASGEWTPESEVKTEGCDCDGNVNSVEQYLDGPEQVYLRR